MHGDSGMIEKKDVVILLSNSGETAEVLNVLGIIEKIGSPCIAITKTKIPRWAAVVTQYCPTTTNGKPIISGWRRPRAPSCNWPSATPWLLRYAK
ncbi:hypothetical protein HMSSN139_10450 [Paenibacillus sp. HMSSN-139]|nr:hypothetical protein HMSSN139_10450 [Paenibacillus sp. HMSSN-139]